MNLTIENSEASEKSIQELRALGAVQGLLADRIVDLPAT